MPSDAAVEQIDIGNDNHDHLIDEPEQCSCLQPVGPGSGGNHRLNDAVTLDPGMPPGAQHRRLTCDPLRDLAD